MPDARATESTSLFVRAVVMYQLERGDWEEGIPAAEQLAAAAAGSTDVYELALHGVSPRSTRSGDRCRARAFRARATRLVRQPRRAGPAPRLCGSTPDRRGSLRGGARDRRGSGRPPGRTGSCQCEREARACSRARGIARARPRRRRRTPTRARLRRATRRADAAPQGPRRSILGRIEIVRDRGDRSRAGSRRPSPTIAKWESHRSSPPRWPNTPSGCSASNATRTPRPPQARQEPSSERLRLHPWLDRLASRAATPPTPHLVPGT